MSGLEHHVEGRRGRAADLAETASLNDFSQFGLAGLATERGINFLGQRGWQADHGRAGIASYAFMTGLTFARFTRPKAELLFADHPIITLRDGKLTLATRVANMRHNELSDVQVKCWVLVNEIVDGKNLGRRLYRATLVRNALPGWHDGRGV